MRFADRRKLVCLALFFGVGCLCALKSSVPAFVWLMLALAPLARFVIKRPRGACFLLAAAVFLGGAWAAYRNERPEIEPYSGATIEGVVCAPPIIDAAQARTVLTLESVKLGGKHADYNIRLYIYGAKDANAFEYGRRVRVTDANTWLPDGVTNPNGFDFASYLWRGGVALCATCQLDDIAPGDMTRSFDASLMRIRARLGAAIDVMFPQSADVARALLLGDRSMLDEAMYEDFKTLGIAHLLALSGMHVGCLALLLDWLFRLAPMPRRVSSFIVVAILVVYARMTGASPSIVRAVLMFAILQLHRAFGYPGDLLTRLATAFIIQLALNPLDLMDAGFQLSYASMLGLALLMPTVSDSKRKRGATVLGRLTKNALAGAWATMRQSASIQLATVPIVCSLFYALPVLGIIINVMAIPLAMLSVMLAAPALALFCVLPGAGQYAAMPSEAIWVFLRDVAARLADLPFASSPARAWHIALGAAYFSLLAVVSAYGPFNPRKRAAGVLTLCAACLIMFVPFGSFERGLTISYLDAGYADSALVSADGRAYLIDCGRDNTIAADALSASARTLKGVFITHPDIDHAGGARAVIKRNPRASVYVPECWARMDVGENVASALKGANLIYLKRGDVVMLSDDIYLEVLWPEEGFTPKDDNDGSLVLNIRYGDASALFMGDLTVEHDGFITYDCDVMKVSHHGSKYATSARLLSATTPACAVISVSGNAHGHPTPEVLDRLARVGARVYRTDLYGAVTIKFEPDGGLHIETVLNPEDSAYTREEVNALATVF